MAEEILQVKRNGDFYYPIYFEEGFDRLADAICTEGLEGRNLCIVTDTHVEPLYAAGRGLPHSEQNLPVFTAPQAQVHSVFGAVWEGCWYCGCICGVACCPIANKFCAFAPPTFAAMFIAANAIAGPVF